MNPRKLWDRQEDKNKERRDKLTTKYNKTNTNNKQLLKRHWIGRPCDTRSENDTRRSTYIHIRLLIWRHAHNHDTISQVKRQNEEWQN